MALFDAMLELSDGQTITTASTTHASENTFNFSDTTQELTGLEMGAGQPMWFNARVGNVAFAATSGSTAGSVTLTIALVNDANTTIDSSSEVMYQSRAFTEDELIKGAWLVRIPLPYDIDKQAYMGALYTVAGDDLGDEAKINVWIDNGSQSSHDTQVAESNI